MKMIKIKSLAGSNEKKFRERILSIDPSINFLGKRRFLGEGEDVEISVDESMCFNGVNYLIEIDSGNMAKLLVGQYVLLNELHKSRTGKEFFLVVHFYKNYNVQRTLKNLKMINRKLFNNNGMNFGSIHFDDIGDNIKNFNDFLGCIKT